MASSARDTLARDVLRVPGEPQRMLAFAVDLALAIALFIRRATTRLRARSSFARRAAR
jgi:hypothetical protein